MAEKSTAELVRNYLAIDPDMDAGVIIAKLKKEHGREVSGKQYIHTTRSEYKAMLRNAKPAQKPAAANGHANGVLTNRIVNDVVTAARHTTNVMSVREQSSESLSTVLVALESLKTAVKILGGKDNVRRALDLLA